MAQLVQHKRYCGSVNKVGYKPTFNYTYATFLGVYIGVEKNINGIYAAGEATPWYTGRLVVYGCAAESGDRGAAILMYNNHYDIKIQRDNLILEHEGWNFRIRNNSNSRKTIDFTILL